MTTVCLPGESKTEARQSIAEPMVLPRTAQNKHITTCQVHQSVEAAELFFTFQYQNQKDNEKVESVFASARDSAIQATLCQKTMSKLRGSPAISKNKNDHKGTPNRWLIVIKL